MHVWLASGADFINGLSGTLSGISSLLLALGTGIGFLVKSRRTARREHLRTEAAASLAAQRAKEALEAKLEEQHKIQVNQLLTQAKDIEDMHRIQIAQLEGQLKVQQDINNNLLNRILRGEHDGRQP